AMKSMLTLAAISTVLAIAVEVRANGPDITYHDCTDVTHYGPVGSVHGYAIGSSTCNIGDIDLPWTNHSGGGTGTPALAMNAFRLNNGRFEQIGQGWCKTACCAAAGTGVCGTCDGNGGNVLG